MKLVRRWIGCGVVVCGMLGAGFAGHAAELVLGEQGVSSFQIVLPDALDEGDIAGSLRRAARLLQQAFATNGMGLAIVSESEHPAERPGIYLGATRFAGRRGIAVGELEGWQFVHKVVDGNLVIAGHDRPGPVKGSGWKQQPLSWYGTLLGVTDFLHRHAGVRFLTPEREGTVFLPRERIVVPADLDEVRRPYVEANDFWGSPDNVFHIAHLLTPFRQVLNDYFGHSHPRAVPVSQYGDTHPEYFAELKGVRVCNLRSAGGSRIGHLCLAHPEVQELIYRQILKDIDEGSPVAALGQGDGYIPCECPACIDLYGVRPTADPEQRGLVWRQDPAWGEKIWILHREMAERLAQDRPGALLMITAYSVTASPPATFDTFPGNVIIELARYTPEYFEAWRRMKGIRFFGAYVYNWGTYQMTGYLPILSPGFIEDQVKLFFENNVRMVRTHGFGQNNGLEGPSQYVYLRMLYDPEANPSVPALVEEYLEAAFGAVIEPMRRFFALLHERLEFNRHFTKSATGKDALFVINALFTPDLLEALDAQLRVAEARVADPATRNRVAMVRAEFDFLRLTANAVQAYYVFLAQGNPLSREVAIRAVEARNAWLAALPEAQGRGDKARVTADAPAFRGRGKYGPGSLKHTRFMAIPPFNWDTEAMRAGRVEAVPALGRLVVRRAAGPVTPESAEWNAVPVQECGPLGMETLAVRTRFKLLYDERNLYLRIDADLPVEQRYLERGRDAELWLQEAIDFCVSTEADREKFHHFAFEPRQNAFYDARRGFIADPLDPLFKQDDTTWNGDWTYENTLLPEEKRWRAMVTVPFETLGVRTPEAGARWLGNVGRVYWGEGSRTHSMWSGQGRARLSFAGESFGEWVFQKD